MYAVFENPGVLDTRLLTTLGTNVKETDNPIGFFGTGMKLALAVCARLGYPVYVEFGDGHRWELCVDNDNVRGKDFSFLFLDHTSEIGARISLPFTTEFGKNWEPWMVLREFESNMRDEKGELYYVHNTLQQPARGFVRFIVGGEFAVKCEEYRRYTFFDKAYTPIYSDERCEIAEHSFTSQAGVFYRGIRVGDYKPMLYVYNIKQPLELTEDRTFKYYWELESRIGNIIKFCTDEQIIARILTAAPQTWEDESNDFVLGPGYYNEPTRGYNPQYETFMRVSERIYEKQPRLLNRHVYKAIRSARRDIEPYEPARTTAEQRAMLRQGISVLHKMGYNIKRYQIVVTVDTENNGKYGWVHPDDPTRIFITPLVFEQGLECVVGTLLEEYCHLDTGYRDATRSMQDWLVRQCAIHMVARATRGKR